MISGKSTLAVAVEKALHSRKHLSYRLDGDNIRLVSHSLTHSLTQTHFSLIHSAPFLTHSLSPISHSLIQLRYSLTHSFSSVTHSLTHSAPLLTHSLTYLTLLDMVLYSLTLHTTTLCYFLSNTLLVVCMCVCMVMRVCVCVCVCVAGHQ